MYSEFAYVYDALMEDAEYKRRAEIIEKLFVKYDRVPKLLLDLACGTGGFSRRFSVKGASVIGVDVSPEMLSVAQEKSEGYDILFLCQNMTELDLYGTVDGAVCCLDSLNHLESYKDFCKALGKVSLFLEKDRLFIFDLNTPYKHKKVLADNIFIKENENVFCVWQNEYDNSDCSVNINLDFFVKTGEFYERRSESFREIAFSNFQINHALKKAGLELVATIDGDSGENINKKTERIMYVTRKIK